VKTDSWSQTMPPFLSAETRYNTRVPQHRELKVSAVKYYAWPPRSREIGNTPGQALPHIGAGAPPHWVLEDSCGLSISTVKCLTMKTNCPNSLDQLPILTDFFICNSQEEARSLALRSDLPEEACNWALISDHNLGTMRLLGFFCPGCCGGSSTVVREIQDSG
jgi:hypothetical protein